MEPRKEYVSLVRYVQYQGPGNSWGGHYVQEVESFHDWDDAYSLTERRCKEVQADPAQTLVRADTFHEP